MVDVSLAGLVIAGGRSTRFGETDKAVADLAGTPMILRVARALDPVVDELVVNCRADQQSAIADVFERRGRDPTFAIDSNPDQGPLAGIATGLAAVSTAEYTMVAACDMPFLRTDVIEKLAESAAGSDVAIPESADGWLHTTAAVYRTEPMASASVAAIESGHGRIVAALSDLDVVRVPDDAFGSTGTWSPFANLNTREEFESAAATFEPT